MSKSNTAVPRKARRMSGHRIQDYWQLYLMLLIPIVLTIIYKYIPMYGI